MASDTKSGISREKRNLCTCSGGGGGGGGGGRGIALKSTFHGYGPEVFNGVL